MIEKLASLFNRRQKPVLPLLAEPSDQTLALEKTIQSLRLELEAHERHGAQLQHEIERLNANQERMLAEMTGAQLESLFHEIASPASQLRTQADLVERQNKPVQVEDVLAVARRILLALQRHGLAFEGNIGAQEGYDPNRHTMLQQSGAPDVGQPVTIRFAGVSYQGKIIYKAIVES